MAERRRLSSIDLLPDEAADDIVWATQELAQRNRTQADILFELNDRLEAKGLDGISKSAFSRHSVNRAAAQREMQEARAIFEGVADQFTAADVDENTMVLGEFMKSVILKLVSSGGGQKKAKDVMELARAFQSTVSAQKISTDRRQKLEAEMEARAMKAADLAVTQVAQARGMSAETQEELRRELFGQTRRGA